MTESHEHEPSNWVFLIGIIFLLVGSALVAILHGSLQFLAIAPFAVSAVCAYVYLKSVVTWSPGQRR